MSNCPCGNEKEYDKCCGIYHSGKKSPETAEILMRARYCAFAKNEINFIAESHMPETKDFDMAEATEWATTSTWKGLEIVSTSQGQENHQTGTVEFKAHYSGKDEKDYLHHEVSTFKKIDNKWHYDQGQIVGAGPMTRAEPKVGRNDPCSCKSGKKFKKCCGA